MKRKMLISIALIVIMLLNCMLPLFVVNAADDQEIKLNSELYESIKKSLTTQGIKFEYDDVFRKLVFSNEVLNSITELNLKNSAIADLTGLDTFASLQHLDLSGNNLNKESNLAVLNNLSKLNYLDLSTNQLDDISSISELINNLDKTGTIVLSSQKIVKVEKLPINTNKDSDYQEVAKFELPSILRFAGYLKPSWQKVETIKMEMEEYDKPSIEPSIKKIPMSVTDEDKYIEITIGSMDNSYYGLLKLTIKIEDTETESKEPDNKNRASENMLNGSEFVLYYIVYPDSYEVIDIKDDYLYKAIKEQLSKEQTVNSKLPSYKYLVNEDGEIVFEEFYFTEKELQLDSGNQVKYRVLHSEPDESRESVDCTYAYNVKENKLYNYTAKNNLNTAVQSKDLIDTIINPIEIRNVGTDGKVSISEGYSVAVLNKGKDGKGLGNLYTYAFDEPKIFLIKKTTLINDITSLILNNKKIRDLSGIEYFVGLDTELNLSHNFLSDIDAIYKLDENKDAYEQDIINNYSYWLNTRSFGNLSTSVSKIKDYMTEIENNIESINDVNQHVIESLATANDLQKGESEAEQKQYAEQIDAIKNDINNQLSKVYGYRDQEGKEVNGYIDNIKNALENTQEKTGLNKELKNVYSYLDYLYSEYNKEYKLTTILAPTLNYQTYEEYEEYEEKTKSLDTAKALLQEQIAYISKLETNEALSKYDIDSLKESFQDAITKESKSIAEDLTKYIENNPLGRSKVIEWLNIFRYIGIESEMLNYCLIERKSSQRTILDGYCYAEEYLKNRIKEFNLEEIPVTYEEEVLKNIKLIEGGHGSNTALKKYIDGAYDYNSSSEGSCENKIYNCKGKYYELQKIIFNDKSIPNGNHDEDNEGTIVHLVKKELKNRGKDQTIQGGDSGPVFKILGSLSYSIIDPTLNENINCTKGQSGHTNHLGPDNEKILYDQVMSLSNKLLISDLSRYIKLARLKNLDISYNADLDNLEGITTLEELIRLDASYCYVADITNIDWSVLSRLRELYLTHNFVSDITPLVGLNRLRTLNLSNNLIAGELNLTMQQCEKLLKSVKDLDLSGNQITDISTLLLYIDYISKGKGAEYLAREDTININLKNQNLLMEIENPINLQEYPTTVNIKDIPKIFSQLLSIDMERTAFGESSENGRLDAEGLYVTLNTRTVGDKVAIVNVIAKSGNGQKVDTCIGEGTKLKIKYKVIDGEEEQRPDDNPQPGKPDTIIITPSVGVTAKQGGTVSFTVKINGESANDKVDWTVDNNSSDETQITTNGVLTIGAEEDSETITVKATSKEKKDLSATVTITIEKETEEPPAKQDTISITPSEEITVEQGKTQQFSVTINEEDASDKVNWSIEGKNSESTNISDEGVLTIGEDEDATSITIKATSKENEELSATVTVSIKKVGDVEPSPDSTTVNTNELGYEKTKTYLKGISPKTPIDDFKTIFLNGKELNVVITKDEEDVTSGYMETGMNVKLLDSDGKDVVDSEGTAVNYIVSVMGDANKDGVANSSDSILIKAHRTAVQLAENEILEAMDINKDGNVNVADTKLLLFHRAEVTGYSLNYTKE